MRQWEKHKKRFPLAPLQCIFSHLALWVLNGQRYDSHCLLYVCGGKGTFLTHLSSFPLSFTLLFFPSSSFPNPTFLLFISTFSFGCVTLKARQQCWLSLSALCQTGWLTHIGWHCAGHITFLKSRVHSLAFSPNCHLHWVSASYSSPGSCSG